MAVAHGLGVPIDATLRAIYRAPALLVADVAPDLAGRLCELLGTIGLETRIVEGEEQLSPQRLFDVALYLRQPGRAWELAEALADFCACDTARALALLTAPPGIVLGSVSQSTVEALERRLPAGAAELVASDPAEARYVLICSGDSAPVRAKLAAELEAMGRSGAAGAGLLADGLDFGEAQRLWATYGRTGMVRIVNRDFLRFEIWFEGLIEGTDPDAAADALERIAGVPAEAAEADGAPFVLEEGVAHRDLEARLGIWIQAGVRVRAELTTFQGVALEVVAANDVQRLSTAARSLGFDVPAPPPFLTAAMPEAHARVARAVLEAAGAEVYFAAAANG
jgi:hypothetical protein